MAQGDCSTGLNRDQEWTPGRIIRKTVVKDWVAMSSQRPVGKVALALRAAAENSKKKEA